MSYREIEDKLQLILPFVFLITMFYLVSQGSRFEDTGLTYDERVKIFEADNARYVESLEERDRKKELRNKSPHPRAHNLDDGIQGDIPIEDLMKGLKGFL